MWNRFSGKRDDSKADLPSQSSRRNVDKPRRPARYSDSIASSNSNENSSFRADDRDPLGFNPTSTSYSSTTRGQYPGAASASIASSYATASRNNNGEPYVAPGLVRNASLADRMPRSSLSRSSRDQDEVRETRNKKRETERSDRRDQDGERRQKRDKRDKKDKGLKRSENRLDEEIGTSRAPGDFPDQVASSGFSQFPGQYDGAIPGPNGAPLEHPAMSSHVQDQFPGQFPTQSSAPYRPPLAASEGGPGLAAEYYGDDGQSVAEQPGNRANTPSLIIGAEPHLQPALAVAAPPPEPSASGAVGAAASFFSGEFDEGEAASTHGQQSSPTYATSQTRPNSNYHSSSAPTIPTTGGAAMGSAAGYFVDSQTSSHQGRPDHESSIAPNGYSIITAHPPPSQTQDSHYSSTSRPTKPGKQSSQSSNIPMYAAGVAGAAGLAAAAYELNHHSSNQHPSSRPPYSVTSMAQRHRNHGPFGALVDFFQDPEGVAQFEEYSQIIGVCRHCFAPGSSPRDAPRNHFYGKRRSNERLGSSTRVDKDSRYSSSETESRRKNNKSWLATGLAGYGLAKVGESLYKETNEFDDTYSVKVGRFSPDRRDPRARRRNRSKERVETGITGDGKPDRKEPRDDVSIGTKTSTVSTKRRSRTRSRSKDRRTGLAEAAIGAAIGTSVVASSSRRRSRSPKGRSIKGKHKSQETSPEKRHETKKKKRDRGFFGFGNGSSSSSSVDLIYTDSQDKHRSSKRSNGKSKDDKKAEAALLGLGAAAAALSLNDGRQGHRKKSVRELVGVKETKDHHGHDSRQAHRPKKPTGNLDDELWESAAEDDYESMNSDLAYGAPVRRDSRASLSSESSGTNKWGWRWGSKKSRRAVSPRRKSSENSSFPAVAGPAGIGSTGATVMSPGQRQHNAMDSTSSLPLQHVYPVPTSDPSRFDVGGEGSIASSSRPVMSSRPEAVPLQHPRPIAPVSAAIYSSQTAYDHSYSAPTGPAIFSQTSHHSHPGTSEVRNNTQEDSIPGSFPRFEQQANDTARDSRLQRRDTSPARFGEDSISSSMAPRRRSSAKDDSSAVRFDLTEEQEEKDRRERRRKRKEDKERREAQEQQQIEKDRRASREQSGKKPDSKTRPEEGPEISPQKSWAGPAAAGVIGAAIGAVAASDRSRSEETREQRRERRRRQREIEDEEDTLSKSERRRRQRERDDQEAAAKESGKLPNETSASREDEDRQGHSPERQDMNVWQEAASTKRSYGHENYGAFFTPIELLNKSSDQVKITSANADADIDLEQVPQIVTVEPKRIHDLSDSPAFSLADTDDKIDPSRISFPWQVPKLRLVEPTPPSTRGSTPISRPNEAGDEGFEEARKEHSPSKVKWADDESHEYTIIAPKEDHDNSIEPVPEESSGTDPVDLPRSTHERDLPDDETHPHNNSAMESSSPSYGEDAEFAATLAASAEDAGFDPSIVINNPAYRRRDSPPGSNERNIPGAFDDEDEPRVNKKERKRKEKASRRQSQNDGANGRDDDAVVQDIISQVEGFESQPSNPVASENVDDEWESTKKAKKAKKGRKSSEPEDDYLDVSEVASKAPDVNSGDVYESPTEDVRSITSTAPVSNEAESGRKSRKKSKRESTAFDDAASTVFSPSTTEASKDSKPKSKDKRKGSLWDRVLGKSTGSLPQENGTKTVRDEAILEDFEEPKKKSKKSKERKSTRDGDDGHNSKERDSVGGSTPRGSGRISPELPAKDQSTSPPPTFADAGSVAQYLDHGIEPDQIEEKQPQSFLGMRPEPPPPPDTHEREELSDPLETTSLPTSPRVESETQSRRFSSDAEISNPTQTTAALPSSPTAVPPHFRRRPGRSSSTARSLSQTPLSSNKSAAEIPPKQKARPRSTEFKSSTEIRPSWLVERHRSHQEPAPEEMSPSLPSSHTTLRSSSMHDREGNEQHHRGDYEPNEANQEPIEVESGPMMSTDSHLIHSDLLDSQQATPIASSFSESRIRQDLPSPQASRDSSPKVKAEENPHQRSSILKSAVPDDILKSTPPLVLNEAIQNNDASQQDLSREENEEFEHGLDDILLDAGTYPSFDDTLDHEGDFVLQKTKKGKKERRKASSLQGETIQSSLPRTVETKPSTNSTDPKTLSVDSMRQLEEQDAQDAVNSWFPSVLPSNKGEKRKGEAFVERPPEENGLSPNTYEHVRDNVESTVPAAVQESDAPKREISREQITNIMPAPAQDARKDENEAFQSTTRVIQEPFGIPQEDLQEKIITHDASPQEDLPQDDFPQGNLPRSDLQQETLAKDDLPHNELPQHDSQQITHPNSDFLQGIHPRDDISQPQDSLPQDGNLQNDPQPGSLPSLLASAPAKFAFDEPFPEEGYKNTLQSAKATTAFQEEHERGNLTTAISPALELSPTATPLPDGDDEHDLLDERLGTPVPTSLDHSDDKNIEIAAENPLIIPHVHDASAVIPGPKTQSQHLPAPAEQVDADNYLADRATKKSKKAKKAKQSFSVDNKETAAIVENDGPLPNFSISPTLEDNRAKDLNDESPTGIPSQKSETVEDDWEGFTSKKKGKGKKANQIFSVESSKTVGVPEGQQSLPDMAASETSESHAAKTLVEESAVDDPQPKTDSLEDEWPGSSVESNKSAEVQEETGPRSEMATSKAPEYHEARDLIDEPAMHSPKFEVVDEGPMELIDLPTNQAPKPGVVVDNWVDFNNKETSRQAEKQKSKVQNLEPGPDEPEHHFERQSNAGDDMNHQPSSLATTQTLEEVSAMLGLGETEIAIGGESKEAFPTESQAEHELQKPLEDQISSSNEWNLPTAYEPETLQVEDAPREAHHDEMSQPLDTSIASTNTAETVQDVLAGVDNAESATDAKRETVLASLGIEDTATARSIENDEQDWDASKKKKKGKKGKKNEVLSWDEPGMMEPAEASGPLSATSTPLEQELAVGKPIEEGELAWDASKKKKKGKKGKKNEVSSWDEPGTMEPTEASGSPGVTNTPLEQEPAVDRPIEEGKLAWDASKKKKKGKKGKKNETLSLDEPEIMEPAELSGLVAAMTPRALEQESTVKAIDEVSSKQFKKGKKSRTKGVSRSASNFQEDIEPSLILSGAPQHDEKVEGLHTIDGVSRDKVEPNVVPTEFPKDDDPMEDRPSITRDALEGEPDFVATGAPQDDDKMEYLPAGGMPPMRSGTGAPTEPLEPAVPTELAQDNRNDKPREAPLEQEQDFMPLRTKKDKKKSKKSKKSNAFSLDDDGISTLDNGETSGAKNFEQDGAKPMIPSSGEVVEESENAVQKTQLALEDDFMLPTTKKDKKKSKKTKKFSAFSLDNDVPPALEDEPVSTSKELEREGPEQTPSSVDVVKESETFDEGLPKERGPEEAKAAEFFEGRTDDFFAQSEQDTPSEPNKVFEDDSNINALNASGHPVIVEGKRGEALHEDFESVSAHAAASGMHQKAVSSVESTLEHPGEASEEIVAYQANKLEHNINPAVETNIGPIYSSEPNQKDEKGTKKARPLTWGDDELSHETRAASQESSAAKDPVEPSIIPVTQDSESFSKSDISAQEIESTEILRPGIESEEDQGIQESVLEEQPSQARDSIHQMVEAERENRFADAKKGKGSKSAKLSVSESEEDQSPVDEKALPSLATTSLVQGNKQTLGQQPSDGNNTAGEMRSYHEETLAGLEREQGPFQTDPEAIDETNDNDLPWDVPVQRVEEPENKGYEARWDEPKIEDFPSSAASKLAREPVDAIQNTEVVADSKPLASPGKDESIPAEEVEILKAHEQRDFNEEYAKELERVVPKTETVADSEPLESLEKDESIPAVEVEILNAQEQRDYNEEYAKELERQLSPLQEDEHADPSRNQADASIFSQSSIDSVMERPYDEEHRPLARPPALEDIIEESRSRPGSVQGSPADAEDDFSPFKSTKNKQKGKKGKKQQPIIWEDETATPPLEPESDQGGKPPTRSSDGPGSGDTDAARPLDLEEPIDQRSLEDRTIASPARIFNTANNESFIENNWSGDYFAMQPSRPAEEDVGREDTHEFRRALSTESPYSTRDPSPAREPRKDQHDDPRDGAFKAYNEDEELGSLATNFHDDSRTEAEPTEEQVKDDSYSDPVLVKNTKKSKKSKKNGSSRGPSPQALGQEGLIDRPQDSRIPITDSLDEKSISRQHSLESPLHEGDEHFSVAERPTSHGRSGTMDEVAAAVSLGASVIVAENLSRRDSKQEGRRGKQAKEAGRRRDSEAEIVEPESPFDREEMPVEEQDNRQTPESENAVREWQHQQAASPQSPPSLNYEALADHPVVGGLVQSSEMPQYRDSAIYVSGSPMISEEIPYHRAVRDSGYPDTETSPVIKDELENTGDPTDPESDVAVGERVGHVQHRHGRAHEIDERQRSTSRNPLEIAVEANSDYDVSVSRPKERRKRSRRRSGAAYNSDDSADSGFDIQRRRRRQAMAGEPRGPSPVSSTTKDRSSVLFGSSPSAREETIAKTQDHDVSPRYDAVREEPTWSFDREGSPQQRSREVSREGRSGNIPEDASEATGYETRTDNDEGTERSLFGDPRSYEDDLLSHSKIPHSSESRGRRRLNTISEDSANETALHKKDKRAVSDVGSPESGVKGRRMRSPLVEDSVTGEYISPDDPILGAGEEKGGVEERSRSRNSDQVSTLSSRHGALAGVTPRYRGDEYRTASAGSMRSETETETETENSIHAIIRTPDQVRSASGLSYRSSGTPPLRRVDRSASGDLRGASRKSEAKSSAKSTSELEAELNIGIPSSSTYDPLTDKGKSRADMADVYEGWGGVRGQSPLSPTRPPSMRKRQSMQLLDLETRLDQYMSENRLLASQKLTAESALQEQARDHSQERSAYEAAMQEHKLYLTRKDSELSELKRIIEQLNDQAAHLTEVNEGLASSRGVDEEHEQRYSQLQAEHANTHEQWQQSTRELENLKEQHTQLSTGMEEIVRHEVNVTLEEKNLELRRLQSELENAKQQVQGLQQQLLASKNSDDFIERDEDYFDSQCQSLCQHVQQWVLRFSKFSDMKACYLASEIRDEKVVDRMENAILDGSDVDDYLRDRVKRRDVFMSVVMTMIWEFIFTRYLFGMDREQRQKLKNLEKTLQEVGPISAVHKWRATTLTLLMKREAFENQRAADTEAVVHEIYDTLATFLPPPSHLVGQIQDSLRKVIDTAVDLSIEMRTQRAEFSMLPPLQPEYDTNGDLARKVYFSALSMNERSGATSSNEALQEQHAVVRMVLFPLVVKNEDDDEQIVVCPAQVLIAEGSKGKKTVRVMSAQGGRSEASLAGSDVRMGSSDRVGGMF